ncbi:MAG: hypothetical protein ACOZNI_12360 [Myxococcota bacterium]
MSEPWRVTAVDRWPDAPVERRLALEVDPRARAVWLGPRVEGTGGLEIQSGAVARSFFDLTVETDVSAAAAWLAGEEAKALLDTVAAGFACETLWTGDLSVSWSEEAWQAGHALIQRVAALIGAPPWP